MDCDRVRARLTECLSGEPAGPDGSAMRAHLAACRVCAEELAALRETWTLLARWPAIEPAPEVGRRLLRRIRRRLVRDAVLAPEAWRAAALAAVIGVGLSVSLSFLVPYTTLVALCRQFVPEPGAFLLAGAAYGVLPLALGGYTAWRRGSPGIWGGMEANVLFLALLLPYAIAQCGEFPLPAQVSFVGGLALGALGGSLVASRLRPGHRPELRSL